MGPQEIRNLQEAYLDVYEDKKVDQDEDGDNDFADIRIARLVASGMSKAEAIVAVKNKEYNEGYKPWDFGPKDKAKKKYTELSARKKVGGSAPGTATRANKIASVGREMRTTLDRDSAMTMTNPKKQGLQPSTQRHTLAAIRGAGGGTTARTKFRKEEFELWVNELVEEGYDLSEYTWDEMYESYLDEGLGSAIKRIFSGKKEAEAPKPESRGEQLRKKYNVGPEKSDTSAKRQILDRSRAKAEKDEKDYGDKPFQKQVANQSKAAHDRYLKAGYSKYGADDARGRGSKAAKRAASLNREEFECIVDTLIEEGYDLSNYTWDEMYDVCLDEICQLDEGAAGDVAARAQKLANQKKGQTPERKKMYQGLADKAAARERGPFRGGTVRKNMTSADRDASRESDAYHSSVFGERSKINQHGDSTYGPGGKPKGKKAERQKSRGVSAESFELYDAILSHLLDEGYASTEESADKIILNMSESWFEEIVEDYMLVKKDGSRVKMPGDPPKAKKELGGYDYTHTDKQKEEMKKTPKTKIGSRFD